MNDVRHQILGGKKRIQVLKVVIREGRGRTPQLGGKGG